MRQDSRASGDACAVTDSTIEDAAFSSILPALIPVVPCAVVSSAHLVRLLTDGFFTIVVSASKGAIICEPLKFKLRYN